MSIFNTTLSKLNDKSLCWKMCSRVELVAADVGLGRLFTCHKFGIIIR